MQRRHLLASVLFTGALPGWALAQVLEKPRLTIAVGGKNLLYYLPLTVAEQLGYFKAEGLDVTIVDFAGGSRALQAVVGGSADVVSGAFEHTVNMQFKGQRMRAFVLQGAAPQIVLGINPKTMIGYKILADLKGKVTSLQDKAEKLAAQIAAEKKDKEDALAKLTDKDKEIEEVKTNWESEKTSHAAVQDQFDKLQKEYAAVQKKLDDLQTANQSLSKQVEDLQAKKEVELDKIVVKPGVEAEGKVLVVNKEFNFIVVAAGNNKGITPGVTFGVFRNNKLVAKATVEKVYETMSAANILPDSGEIKEGDIAKAM